MKRLIRRSGISHAAAPHCDAVSLSQTASARGDIQRFSLEQKPPHQLQPTEIGTSMTSPVSGS